MSDDIVSELCEIGTKYGTDKAPWCWAYTKVYSQWVKRDIKTVLEIGVLKGASLRMWRDYFPDAQIFGIDNEPKCMIEGIDRIKTFCVNAYKTEEMRPILEQIGPIDLFVDDGDHNPGLQIGLLRFAWPYLQGGGVYAIEDIYVGDQIRQVEAAVAAMPEMDIFRVYVGKEGYSMIIMRKACAPSS